MVTRGWQVLRGAFYGVLGLSRDACRVRYGFVDHLVLGKERRGPGGLGLYHGFHYCYQHFKSLI